MLINMSLSKSLRWTKYNCDIFIIEEEAKTSVSNSLKVELEKNPRRV